MGLKSRRFGTIGPKPIGSISTGSISTGPTLMGVGVVGALVVLGVTWTDQFLMVVCNIMHEMTFLHLSKSFEIQ